MYTVYIHSVHTGHSYSTYMHVIYACTLHRYTIYIHSVSYTRSVWMYVYVLRSVVGELLLIEED